MCNHVTHGCPAQLSVLTIFTRQSLSYCSSEQSWLTDSGEFSVSPRRRRALRLAGRLGRGRSPWSALSWRKLGRSVTSRKPFSTNANLAGRGLGARPVFRPELLYVGGRATSPCTVSTAGNTSSTSSPPPPAHSPCWVLQFVR